MSSSRTSQQARLMVEADKDARSQTNREIDEAFERWNAAEAALSQAHIAATRDLRQIFEDIQREPGAA